MTVNEEIWKDIEGYEGLYQVSNYGRVKRMFIKGAKKETILKLAKNKTGYIRVCLSKNSKKSNKHIHRLVAEAFIPNPNNLPQINHKDENPNNNYVDNLEWCNGKYNTNYGTRNKRISTKLSKRIKPINKITFEEFKNMNPKERFEATIKEYDKINQIINALNLLKKEEDKE